MPTYESQCQCNTCFVKSEKGELLVQTKETFGTLWVFCDLHKMSGETECVSHAVYPDIQVCGRFVNIKALSHQTGRGARCCPRVMISLPCQLTELTWRSCSAHRLKPLYFVFDSLNQKHFFLYCLLFQPFQKGGTAPVPYCMFVCTHCLNAIFITFLFVTQETKTPLKQDKQGCCVLSVTAHPSPFCSSLQYLALNTCSNTYRMGELCDSPVFV